MTVVVLTACAPLQYDNLTASANDRFDQLFASCGFDGIWVSSAMSSMENRSLKDSAATDFSRLTRDQVGDIDRWAEAENLSPEQLQILKVAIEYRLRRNFIDERLQPSYEVFLSNKAIIDEALPYARAGVEALTNLSMVVPYNLLFFASSVLLRPLHQAHAHRLKYRFAL